MKQAEIENLLEHAHYAEALEGLAQRPPSTWRDTSELRCLRALGRGERALRMAKQLYRSAQLSTKHETGDSERNDQLRGIALIFAEQGQARKACDIFQALCDQNPDNAALRHEYAYALVNDLQFDGAELELLTALAIKPTASKSYSLLASVYRNTGRVDAAMNCYYRAATLEPDNPRYLQKLAHWSDYCSSSDQQLNYHLTQLWAHKAFPYRQQDSNTWRAVKPNRQLKLAFISSNFCKHEISFSVLPLLANLDRDEFHISAFSCTHTHDAMSKKIKAECDSWRDCASQTDNELARQILQDQIDVLVDLDGHTDGNRLAVFAQFNAPLQISWLGYASTSGLESIAYRITDQVADPTDVSDAYFSEELIRLVNGFICYQPLATAPDIRPRKNADALVLGSFANLNRISNKTIDSWSYALHALPDAVLHLRQEQLINASAHIHLIEQFKQRGIDEGRLRIKTSKLSEEQFLAEYNEIDIALDTTPYNDMHATLEALWMGVPVVSLSSNTHASRLSASILHRVGLSKYAVNKLNDFTAQICDLANDPALRSDLRAKLRGKMQASSLMQHQRFAEEFGASIRDKWRLWCAQQSARQQRNSADQQPVSN